MWQLLQSSVYTIKSGYYTAAMKYQIPLLSNADSFDWIKKMWALWSARNMCIFENRTLTSTEMVTKAVRLAREWNNAQNQDSAVNRPLPSSGRAQQHLIDTGSVTTCRSNAAYDKRSKRAWLASIFTESSGLHFNQRSTMQDLVGSSLMAEALALRSGILCAVQWTLCWTSSRFSLTT